jgi:hypothetical protein
MKTIPLVRSLGIAMVGLLVLASATRPEGTAARASDSLPILFYWTQPYVEGQEGQARTLMWQVEAHINANYADSVHVAVFEDIFGGGTFHYFNKLADLPSAWELGDVLTRDEGWNALTERAETLFDERAAWRGNLFPLAGAPFPPTPRPYRWLRVTRTHRSKLPLAQRFAARVVEHLEARYPEIDARAYSADLHDPGAIYWMFDYDDLAAWESVRARMLADDDYVALYEGADDLFIEEETKEWMIVD